MYCSDSHERFLETLEAVQALLELITKREEEINQLYERIELLQSLNMKRDRTLATLGLNDDLIPGEMNTNLWDINDDDSLQDGILIIEAFIPMRHKLREMIASGGFPIINEVSGINEALGWMVTHTPMMVIIGSVEKDDTGPDTIRDMRAINPRLKAIIITEANSIGGLVSAVRHQDVEIMNKPINRLRLLEKVNSLLKQPSACEGSDKYDPSAEK